MALAVVLTLGIGLGWFVGRFGPQSAYAHYRQGVVWSEKLDYDKAIAEYSEAARLDPELANAYYCRGDAWLAKKDYDKAIADHNESVRLDPRSAQAYYGRAVVRSEKKDFDKAIEDYDEAIRLDPDSPYAYYGRAVVWSQKSEYDRAILDYSDAIRRESPVVYTKFDWPESTYLGESQQVFKAVLALSFCGRGDAWLAQMTTTRLSPTITRSSACRRIWGLPTIAAVRSGNRKGSTKKRSSITPRQFDGVTEWPLLITDAHGYWLLAPIRNCETASWP